TRQLFYISHANLFFSSLFFFLTSPAPTEIYTLSLHDALPIFSQGNILNNLAMIAREFGCVEGETAVSWLPFHHDMGLVGHVLQRSEEHTSELQSRENLVCRLLLEKKNEKENIRGKRKARPIIE